jgi:RND family efflux transporter MFP subunit
MTVTRRCMPLTVLALLACGPADDAPDAGAPEGSAGGHESRDAARVTLTPAAERTAGIQVEAVAEDSSTASGEALTVPGQVDFDPRRVALISSRIPGRVERLAVVVGDRVRAGQPVAELFSAGFVTAQTDFVRAADRVRSVAGTPDSAGAGAVAQAARRRLEMMGVTGADLRRLAETGEPTAFLVLAAPFDGSIMETHVLVGGAVEAGQPVFRIADLSVVDVVADVPERALALVRVGQTATIELAAYPATPFAGRVVRLHDELDLETRTVHAVIHVPNPSGHLRPGMYASVSLDLPVRAVVPAGTPTVLTIPEAALVTDGETRYAFVRVAPHTYERREVLVTSLAPAAVSVSTSGRVAVRSGLSRGELVVVRGAFTLKSELAKAAFAEDEH